MKFKGLCLSPACGSWFLRRLFAPPPLQKKKKKKVKFAMENKVQSGFYCLWAAWRHVKWGELAQNINTTRVLLFFFLNLSKCTWIFVTLFGVNISVVVAMVTSQYDTLLWLVCKHGARCLKSHYPSSTDKWRVCVCVWRLLLFVAHVIVCRSSVVTPHDCRMENRNKWGAAAVNQNSNFKRVCVCFGEDSHLFISCVCVYKYRVCVQEGIPSK